LGSSGRRGYILVFLLLVSLLSPPASAQQLLVSITILDGGLARVDYLIPAAGNISLTIPLIGEPDASYLVLVQDEEGMPLAYEINETLGVIEVACLNASEVRISYYTQALTYKRGKIWAVNFSSPYRVKLTLPPNSTVIYFSTVPEEVTVEGDALSFVFSPGTILVKYIFTYLAPPPEEKPPAQEITEEEVNATGEEVPQAYNFTQASNATLPEEREAAPTTGLHPDYLTLLAVAAILAAAVAAVLWLRRRSPPYYAMELSEEEVEILETLRRMGGGAFQSELQRALDMPTTSLWRRLRRLREKGLVVIEKRSGRNYVKLA